jgi:hypothetical protein
MTGTDVEAALSAANPLTDRAAVELSLHGAEVELVERIVSIDVHPRPSRARARAPRRWRFAVVLGVAAVAAVVLALLPSGQRDGGPAPAFAASLVRFANASPLALLQLPGWHVVYANEESGGFGEMHFVRGPANADGTPGGASFRKEASLAGRVASLTWGPANAAAQKFVAGGHQAAATGLAVTARRFVREGGSRGWLDVSAMFIDGGRELTFRATVTDMPMFRAELRALHAVDTATWLRAMPPSVVKTADSGETIRLMLKGIPVPPGFDAAKIRGARLVHDRYQLGTAVTGTVACMWIADWNHARTAGDAAMVRRAIAAMATAPRWPILREMTREGAWPEVLIMDAKAMPSGRVKLDAGQPGRPLIVDANSALGCSSEWGVRLGR